jgi:hypothetical protein
MTGDRTDTLDALLKESEALQRQLRATTEGLKLYAEQIKKAVVEIRKERNHADE